MADRVSKRAAAVASMKASQLYLELPAEVATSLKLPDPEDGTISKRKWEYECKEYRQAVRRIWSELQLLRLQDDRSLQDC